MLQEYYIVNNGKQVVRDKEKEAIERIIGFEDMALAKSPDGYYVCDSGGKDRLVLCNLFICSGAACDFHHNFTTCDHPLTNKYVRERRDYIKSLGYNYTIHYPKDKDGKPTSIWKEIPKRGMPTRFSRWCCAIFKEAGGIGRCIATGVRWAESLKRANNRGQIEVLPAKLQNKIIRNNDNDETRQAIEGCLAYQKLVLNPIIDWSDEEVWEYIHKYNLIYNPLYDMGYTRVGCVGCPMSTRAKGELEANPQFYKAYYRAAKNQVIQRLEKNPDYPFKSAQELMDWWLAGKSMYENIDQISIDDLTAQSGKGE